MEFKIKTPNKYCSSKVFEAENPNKMLYAMDGEFYISGVESQEEADALIEAHNPPVPSEPTVEEKLASVGLTVADLKVALGLA